MRHLTFLYYLFFAIFSYAQSEGVKCPACDVEKCALVINCQYGTVSDECNCCQVCGKGENEQCGLYNNKCGTNLFCNHTAGGNEVGMTPGTTFNVTGICARTQKLQIPEMMTQAPKSHEQVGNETEPNMTGYKSGFDNRMGEANDVTTARSSFNSIDNVTPSDKGSAASQYLKSSLFLCCLLLVNLLH